MVEVFRTGDVFGEVAVIDGSARTTEAIAVGHVRLLRIRSTTFLAVAVDWRISMNMIATKRSVSAAPALRWRQSAIVISGGNKGNTAISCVGRSWQARRTLRAAQNRARTDASCCSGGGRSLKPWSTRTRQVEQRPEAADEYGDVAYLVHLVSLPGREIW
jgi:CRP-like cAMP-binding protein